LIGGTARIGNRAKKLADIHAFTFIGGQKRSVAGQTERFLILHFGLVAIRAVPVHGNLGFTLDCSGLPWIAPDWSGRLKSLPEQSRVNRTWIEMESGAIRTNPGK
jgi:hypothetical protein